MININGYELIADAIMKSGSKIAQAIENNNSGNGYENESRKLKEEIQKCREEIRKIKRKNDPPMPGIWRPEWFYWTG